MFSKSRAANFRSPETLFEKRLMASLPKLGICRKLQIEVSVSTKGCYGEFIYTGDPVQRLRHCLHYSISGEGE